MSSSPNKIVGTVVCLPVRDLERSLRFYQAVFELADLEANEGMVVVELPNLSLFLLEENVFADYSQKVGRQVAYPDGGSSVILSCAIDSRESLDSILEAAEVSGGTVPKPAVDDEWTRLYIGYFFDPDGHHWELAHSDQQG
ncbi:MAG: VOC family protein [Ancrocorticia sp.]